MVSGSYRSVYFVIGRARYPLLSSVVPTVSNRGIVRWLAVLSQACCKVPYRSPERVRADQVIAYAGLDIQIKESGLWKGQAKLSKRGSGLLRQMLYLAALRSIHLEGSAFGAYYRRLLERGRKCGSALMAVMRKMLAVAVHLLKHEQEDYDRSLVAVGNLAG